MKNYEFKILSLLLVASVGGFLACSDRALFERMSLNEALVELGDSGGIISDTDGDGVPDAIVGDDGTVIPITPPDDVTPIEDDNPDVADDDVPPPVRDDAGNCIFTSATAARSFSSSNQTHTYTKADLGGQKNFLVNLTGSSNTITVDLEGVTNLERLIFKHAGNSNRINVVNTSMKVGLCNEMSGGSNDELLDESNSAALVDLESGTGNNNDLDVRFKPSFGLKYAISGNSNCVSAPVGTFILSGSSPEDGALLDGNTCLE